MTEDEKKAEQDKSFDYWIGNPQSKGTDVIPKDRPYFLEVLKREFKDLLKSNSDLRSKNRTLNVDKEMLKGENGSLKEINADLTEENQQLEKENAELKVKYSEHIRDSHDNYFAMCNEKDEEIENLIAQIEKMKCCGNCKNKMHEIIYDDVIECKYGLSEQYEKDCDEWELKDV